MGGGDPRGARAKTHQNQWGDPAAGLGSSPAGRGGARRERRRPWWWREWAGTRSIGSRRGCWPGTTPRVSRGRGTRIIPEVVKAPLTARSCRGVRLGEGVGGANRRCHRRRRRRRPPAGDRRSSVHPPAAQEEGRRGQRQAAAGCCRPGNHHHSRPGHPPARRDRAGSRGGAGAQRQGRPIGGGVRPFPCRGARSWKREERTDIFTTT